MAYSLFEIYPSEHNEELKQIKNIYLSSFPREERTPWFRLIKDLSKCGLNHFPTLDYYCLMVGIRDADKKMPVLGFAVLEYVKSANLCFMGYIAINPAYRSRGIGSYLMNAIKDYFTDLSSRFNAEKPIGFFYEIKNYDLPRYDQKARGEIFSRYRFYNRLNQKKLDIPYFQPALLPWYPDVPMYLMVSPFEEFDSLANSDVSRIINGIYAGIYQMSAKKLEKSLKRLNKDKWPQKISLLSLDAIVTLNAQVGNFA